MKKKTTQARSKGKAGAADAELILKLYDLRREGEMRKARNYVAQKFNPQTADEAMEIFGKFDSPENAWLRQVMGYWEMAASFVLHGALDAELFHASNNEMYFVFAKIAPVLKEVRERMDSPDMFGQVEKIVYSTAEGRQRIARMQQRIKRFAAQVRAASAK